MKNQDIEMNNESADDIKSAEDQVTEKTDQSENPPQTDEKEATIKILEGQLQTQKDQLLRTFAEFENYKRRNEQEKTNLIKFGGESIIKDLLTIVDDFERSLSAAEKTSDPEAIKEGIKLVHINLQKMLEMRGVKSVESAGKKFNVDEHEALMHLEKEGVEPDTIVEEVQKGYSYNGKVIRHAKVLVAK